MPSLSAKILALAVLGACALALSGGTYPVAAQNTGSISGRVVNDVNHDGMAGADEPGLSGWLVKLESTGNEPLLRETRTNAEGRYLFRDVPFGDYDVTLPCDRQPSLWGGTPNEFGVYSIALQPGSHAEDGFAVIPIDTPPSRPHTATITGRLVQDQDRDGDLEAAEPGIGGWEVTADLPDQPTCFPESIKTVTTDTDGRFHFAGLVRGRWVLAPGVPENPPLKRWAVYSPDSGTFSDGENDWLAGIYADVSEAGTTDATIGIIPLEGTASISGVIYFDSDRSGVYDQGEPLVEDSFCGIIYRTPKGYSPVLPNLGGGAVDGRYEFSGLAAGSYMVGEVFLSGIAVNPSASANGFPESLVTLADGEQRTGVDFGFALPPGGPTPEIVPTAEPPTPIAPTPTPILTPAPSLPLAPPVTGFGGASSHNDFANLAAALAVAGALAVGASALPARRRARFRR